MLAAAASCASDHRLPVSLQAYAWGGALATSIWSVNVKTVINVTNSRFVDNSAASGGAVCLC